MILPVMEKVCVECLNERYAPLCNDLAFFIILKYAIIILLLFLISPASATLTKCLI